MGTLEARPAPAACPGQGVLMKALPRELTAGRGAHRGCGLHPPVCEFRRWQVQPCLHAHLPCLGASVTSTGTERPPTGPNCCVDQPKESGRVISPTCVAGGGGRKHTEPSELSCWKARHPFIHLSVPWLHPYPQYNQGQLPPPSGGFPKLPNELSALICDSYLSLHYLQFRNVGKSSFFR